MPPSRRTLAELAALAALVAALLYFGLEPFDVRRPNQVRWNAGQPSLVFDGNGMAYSRRELRIGPTAEGGLSIEAWVFPSLHPASRRSTILALDDGSGMPIEITTEGRSLSLRYPLEDEDGVRSYALSLAPTLERGREGYLAVASGPGGTRLYIDGVAPLQLRSPYSLLEPEREFRARLVLGSSLRGKRGWTGEFRGVALYERTLGESEVAEHAERVQASGPRSLLGEPGLKALYVFDEGNGRRVRNLVDDASALDLPEWIWALRWDVLTAPPALSALRSETFRQDVLLNLLGFVPLGLLLTSLGRRRLRGLPLVRFAAACGAGALLSLGIELGQAMLPSRYSSVLDLLLNVTGTALGSGLWLLVERVQSMQAKPAQQRERSAQRGEAERRGRP
jgi:VanZ family protein